MQLQATGEKRRSQSQSDVVLLFSSSARTVETRRQIQKLTEGGVHNWMVVSHDDVGCNDLHTLLKSSTPSVACLSMDSNGLLGSKLREKAMQRPVWVWQLLEGGTNVLLLDEMNQDPLHTVNAEEVTRMLLEAGRSSGVAEGTPHACDAIFSPEGQGNAMLYLRATEKTRVMIQEMMHVMMVTNPYVPWHEHEVPISFGRAWKIASAHSDSKSVCPWK